MSPWVTTRSAEPTSPALGRWSGGRGGAHLSFLLFLREGGLSPCGNQGWEGIVGSMCPACKPGLGPSHGPAWRPGSLPSYTPGRGGGSGSLCSQELASELLLMGQPSTPCWRPVGWGCSPQAYQWGSGYRWGRSGQPGPGGWSWEQRNWRAGSRVGGPQSRVPAGQAEANKVSAVRPLERPATWVWAETGRVFHGPHVSQEPRGLRPAWVGPAPGATSVGSLFEFL